MNPDPKRSIARATKEAEKKKAQEKIDGTKKTADVATLDNKQKA
jgi:hypothetical protein